MTLEEAKYKIESHPRAVITKEYVLNVLGLIVIDPWDLPDKIPEQSAI